MDTPPLSIYVFNSLEDEWSFISKIDNKAQRQDLIENSSFLSDSYLFMNVVRPDAIVITPRLISNSFKKYVESLANVSLSVVSPHNKTHSICKNIIADKKLFARLVKAAKQRENNIALYGYVSTPQLHFLVQAFESKGITVELTENTPKQSLWCVDYFGSKAGFRSIFAEYMPPGFVCFSLEHAVQKARYIYKKKRAVVIKTNRGSSGNGTIIIKNDPHPDFFSLLSKDSYWKSQPIVVEEYINTSKETTCPFPSIEGFIDEKGKISFPYYCNMIVTKDGEFYGMVMHEKSVKTSVVRKIKKITQCIGETYAKAGFRGTFDVDFLFDGKRLYANESNTRTNGGTDTYCLIHTLVGDAFLSARYVLSNYVDVNWKKKYSLFELLEQFKSILYNKKTKTGLIIGSEQVLEHNGFSFIIVGKNKTHSLLLLKEMRIILEEMSLTIKKNKE